MHRVGESRAILKDHSGNIGLGRSIRVAPCHHHIGGTRMSNGRRSRSASGCRHREALRKAGHSHCSPPSSSCGAQRKPTRPWASLARIRPPRPGLSRPRTRALSGPSDLVVASEWGNREGRQSMSPSPVATRIPLIDPSRFLSNQRSAPFSLPPPTCRKYDGRDLRSPGGR